MRGLSTEAAQKVYSQKTWMKNRFMQHSERLKVIQMPFYGACGVSGLMFPDSAL
jgi:hypothetical protein